MAAIWLDDRLVDSAGAGIAINDRGLLLGDGLFDTALVLGGRVFRRDDHLDRLVAGLAELAIPVERALLEAAMDALAATLTNGSARLTVTRGPGPRGLAFPSDPHPTILGTTAPLAPDAMFRPMRLALSDIRRNESSPTSRLKTLGYLDAILANRAAREAGADEALFLNSEGRIACSALGNLFLCRGDRLLTPPLADGVLPGIMRRWILQNAASVGVPAVEAPLAPSDIEDAPLFVCNSLRLIAPAQLSGGRDQPMPEPLRRLTERLCAAIAAECGADPRDLGAVLSG